MENMTNIAVLFRIFHRYFTRAVPKAILTQTNY